MKNGVAAFESGKYYTYIGDWYTPSLFPQENHEYERKGTVISLKSIQGTVSLDMVNVPIFTGFYLSQLVHDFFHQQYNPHFNKTHCLSGPFWNDMKSLKTLTTKQNKTKQQQQQQQQTKQHNNNNNNNNNKQHNNTTTTTTTTTSFPILLLPKQIWFLVGGFLPPIWKNMQKSNLDKISSNFRVEIPKKKWNHKMGPSDTPWKFNSSPLKSYLPNRKGSSSNHHFSGASC